MILLQLLTTLRVAKSSGPIGAIIGWAVGGGCGCATVVLLTVFVIRRRRIKHDAQKVKKGKQKKKTQFSEGDVYENACEKSTPGNIKYENAAFEDNLYENPEGSKPCKTPKKNVNADGLLYADLAFNDQPKGQKKLVIHGLDEMTTYVQVDFNKKADPLPDSDTEEQSENKKK